MSPFASPDGRYFVFSTNKEGAWGIWRMNVDGSNLVRLTQGPLDNYPSVTEDGKWVIFTALSDARPRIFKVSIDGGTPVPITDHIAIAGIVSPDMKWVTFFYPESPDPSAPSNRIAIMPFEGGEIKSYTFVPGGTVPSRNQWSSDSQSVFYTTTANNTSNIWSQPISGGPAKQVTDFKDNLITGFAWSPDGKQLAATRGALLRDAVLITDVKK